MKFAYSILLSSSQTVFKAPAVIIDMNVKITKKLMPYRNVVEKE
jgi:hypothetical protein